PRRRRGMVDSASLPRFGTGLSAKRGSPKSPSFLTGGLVVGREKAARAGITARNAGNYQVPDRKRRPGRAVVLRRIRHFDVPDHGTRVTVEGEQMSVVGNHE